jgi:asparagine synthase (glutamine-hydrolysing)
MSGLLGVFTTGTLPGRAALGRMAARLEARGGDRTALWRGDGAVLGVTRYEWELEEGFSGPVLVLEEEGCVVAADATLYHLADLRRRLRARGEEARGATPSHLILAAYRAWGEGCTRWLEGDFAFILWDTRERRLLASRDFSGRRRLFYADLGETLVIGSTVGAVLEHPACPEELNLPVLAATASMLLSAGGAETSYRAIQVFPAASDLLWSPGSRPRVRLHWEPSPAAGVAELPFERAAEELNELLSAALREQLGREGPTTVWMSGGWDSTAVFGIGKGVLRAGGRGGDLQPVSMSYPVGDPGREDEVIERIADYWGVRPHWVDSEGVSLFDDPLESAARRDEPLAQLYETWNRALAAASRECGARVALDGCGGDQLFQVSDIFLSDLLRRGRWSELVQECRIRGGRGRRHLLVYALAPLLPQPISRWFSALLRGDGVGSPYGRPLAKWLDRDFVRRHDLLARERALVPESGAADRVAAEASWYLTTPLLLHGLSLIAELALQEGVELRSPLYDRRVVEFALARPRWERASGRETKYLLRRSVRGLLPDEVLAPRPHRTGVTVGYSRRRMRESYPAHFEELFASPLVLAELGIVDTEALKSEVSEYLRAGGDFRRVSLFYTLQAEWWLRARSRKDSSAIAPVADCSGQSPEFLARGGGHVSEAEDRAVRFVS